MKICQLKKEEERLAYLVGLTVGDGHLERGSKRIVINSSQEKFIKTINNMLIEMRYPTSCFFDKGANEWKVATRSAKLYNLFLSKYGVIAGNKTVANMDLKIPKQVIKYFLSGLFDAEGWWDLDKGKYLRMRLKMKNQSIVDFIFKSLRELGIEARRHQNKENSFVVEINKQKEVRKFLGMMTLIHPRWLSIR
jgi:intein/homing endonuclease